LGLCPERTVVVWLGRVDISPKGIDTLIEAWLQVRATSVGSPILLLLGTGSGAAWLRSRIAELELDDICWRDEFVLDRAVVSTYLAAGDLYVLPSRQEGFPVAPMEAMAAGLPVVACDAPGVRAVIGEGSEAGGIIVPAGDAVALAGALRVLIEDGNLRTSLGDTAIRRVADRFSIDAVGVRLRAVLLGT
jgi:glycosyltransferase involved in cell wall biosynthesis